MQPFQQPAKTDRAQAQTGPGHVTPLQWFKRKDQDLDITSLGEYFLPFFLAALEACWVNAALIGLAGLNFFGSPSALLPLWGPFALLFASVWLFRRSIMQGSNAENESEDQEKTSRLPGMGLANAVLSLLTILLIWARIYSSSSFLFDPAWLLQFTNDLLALNMSFYQALFIIAMTLYFSWRGIKLSQLNIEPGAVFRQIRLGLIVFLVAILFHANQTSNSAQADTVILLLLIPIFLYLSLSTHALARVVFIRHEHPFGLDGSASDQERSILSLISIVGAVLLVFTIIGGLFFNSTFFRTLQPIGHAIATVYNWLVTGLSQVLALLVTPFFLLAGWWFSLFSQHSLSGNPPKSGAKNPVHPIQIDSSQPIFGLIVKVLLPILILVVLIILVRVALKRRKRIKARLNRKGGDIHESVWSWQLFWQQLKALCWSLWKRLFSKAKSASERAQAAEELAAPPAVRTIREMYRALLKKAALIGYTRKRDETPREFQQRLEQRLPGSEPQLGLLTDAYTLTRYGGLVPGEGQLASARGSWQELERKWDSTSQS